ncbi:MAG: sensor histidine kinase [Hyphomicrobiales bacterium]
MFTDLRTGTKLVILCSMFIAALVATTYSLIAEKQIAIKFARKELIGTRYIEAAHNVYGRVLVQPPFTKVGGTDSRRINESLAKLSEVQQSSGDLLQAVQLTQAFDDGVRQLPSEIKNGVRSFPYVVSVLETGRRLVSRVADESNLSLDPDIDTYYLQNLVTEKLPAFIGRLGEFQLLYREAVELPEPSPEQLIRFQFLDGLLRSLAGEINRKLVSAYRGNPGDKLRPAVEPEFSAMMASLSSYLGGLNALFTGGIGEIENEQGYTALVEKALASWFVAQKELDKLLESRIDGFIWRMQLSLALTGALALLSIAFAVLTYMRTVGPLKRLEAVATTVRETKNYNLRVDHKGDDEIGMVTAAFNDMLDELSAARERERVEQSELARVARVTTMGAMTASIAHEINQPLAAIVTNSNAAKRWLKGNNPNVEEALSALENIVKDGHRASHVIGSVRAMFQKDSGDKISFNMNDVVEDVLTLAGNELRKNKIRVKNDLADDLPNVHADQVQMQQVVLNLIMNAVEAMNTVEERKHTLTVTSAVDDDGMVNVAVADTGPGIAPHELERIFETFFTTKSKGMGMGLSICRSILEAHGGRLTASSAKPIGTIFEIVLPAEEGQDA